MATGGTDRRPGVSLAVAAATTGGLASALCGAAPAFLSGPPASSPWGAQTQAPGASTTPSAGPAPADAGGRASLAERTVLPAACAVAASLAARALKSKSRRPLQGVRPRARVALGAEAGAAAATAVAGSAEEAPGGAAETDADDDDDGPEHSSDLGVDYSKLRGLLKAGEFKDADAESRRLLIEMCGIEAVKRGWAYFAEVKNIPEADMLALNDHWEYYSKGKFGFAPQRKIWLRVRQQFDKFAEEVSWFTDKWKNRNWPDEFIYDTKAPVGHLPLTNCIRGAQVLSELMNHKAFEKKRKVATKGSSSSSKAAAAEAGAPKKKRSALEMLAHGRGRGAPVAGQQVPTFTGSAVPQLHAVAAHRGAGVRRAAEAALADPPAAPRDARASLADAEEFAVINDHGMVIPSVGEDVTASAFVIYDANHKAQYLGFSKDLRNTLRTLLCRRPELVYFYKCEHFVEAGKEEMLALRKAWVEELGDLPVGNKDSRQKVRWEAPVDGGAMSERAYKTVAEQKAKQIVRQLKDRGVKELMEFKEELIAQGKVDVMPSTLKIEDLEEQAAAMSDRTCGVDMMVGEKQVQFELFFVAEFPTNGGWWVDVEVSAHKTKTMHRVVVGKPFMESVKCEDPREICKNAFAVLLANKVPLHTDGMIASEVFPSNYFTASTLATMFPGFLDLFGINSDKFDFESAQWGFKQIHDYQQDDKRTVPVGPMGGMFDPLALQ